jgi:hypothetical protein
MPGQNISTCTAEEDNCLHPHSTCDAKLHNMIYDLETDDKRLRLIALAHAEIDIMELQFALDFPFHEYTVGFLSDYKQSWRDEGWQDSSLTRNDIIKLINEINKLISFYS